MKRIVIVLLLVLIAGIAGIVRSSSHSGAVAGLKNLVSHHDSQGDVREEIRRTFELAPGATVDISGINGAVKIETSDTKTAEVFIERKASSPEALQRRKINVEADANSLRISSEKGDGFFSRLFGSKGSETVNLKLPKEISLRTKGINGSLIVGEITGSVEVRGVNGRVQISGASGTADFKGINGNISVGLKELERDGVSINGVNGNIELRLGPGLNADLDANGMNGRVISEIPGVTVEQYKHGKYSALIGTGGNAISVRGINGNIRLTRTAMPTAAAAEVEGNAGQ